jgi:hypothetical protein
VTERDFVNQSKIVVALFLERRAWQWFGSTVRHLVCGFDPSERCTLLTNTLPDPTNF